MNPLIITAAIVGAEVTREDTPFLPITVEEIAEEAARCREAGASIIHLHVRDEKGQSTQNQDIFRAVIDAIKKKTPEVIIQVSTGGAVGMTPDERLQPVYLKPEMATLSTGSANFGADVFLNRPQDIDYFAQKMQEYQVKPEIEVFDSGMINNALNLVKKGLLHHPLHFDFVLGVPGAMPAAAKNLLFLIESIPVDATWTVSGIGRQQLTMNVLGIALGGHVRTGFEDNIYYSRGTLARGSWELVARLARIAGEMGRPIAAPDDARSILKINI